MTSRTNATMMSVGAMGRSLLMDDVQGDPVSLALGLNVRYVPDHARTDVFCPYSGLVNFEANCSIGREFDHLQFWVYRIYGIASLGQATQGMPWVRGDFGFEVNDRRNVNQAGLMVLSNWGFGREHAVNIDQFKGYGNVWHQNIDVKALYRRVFRVWGSFGVEAGYRVYAQNAPRNEIFGILKYDLPFSPF